MFEPNLLRAKNGPLAVAVPIIAAAIGGGATLASSFMSRPKTPVPAGAKMLTPAGESTELKPGQKTNAINTTPQGVLSEQSSARSTLLGN